MTRTERLLELMQRLRRSRQPLQAHTLAEQLDISVRTLYRDIETLRRQGADIEGEAGVGYVLKRGGPTLPPLMFRESEIEALVLGLRWVSRHADPALADDARPVRSVIVRGQLGRIVLLTETDNSLAYSDAIPTVKRPERWRSWVASST